MYLACICAGVEMCTPGLAKPAYDLASGPVVTMNQNQSEIMKVLYNLLDISPPLCSFAKHGGAMRELGDGRV